MKKAEPSEDQALEATMEDSSTSLAPTILYLTTFEAAPATEESLILPVTSLWPQVRGPRPAGHGGPGVGGSWPRPPSQGGGCLCSPAAPQCTLYWEGCYCPGGRGPRGSVQGQARKQVPAQHAGSAWERAGASGRSNRTFAQKSRE